MMVEPIRNKKKIELIKKILNDNPRNLLIFVMGLNTGLRMGDILSLKIEDIKGKQVGDKVYLIEQKTKKRNYFLINQEIYRVLTLYLNSQKGTGNTGEWLFPSRKGKGHLITPSVNRMIKKWCRDVGLKGNYGCHTLRKTFGYFQHKNNVSIAVLMKRFNHSSPAITTRYIGITEKDVDNILMMDI